MKRLTTNKDKVFARNSITLNSMPKSELRHHYNEIFDRLKEIEEAEAAGVVFCLPCKVGDTVHFKETGKDMKIKGYSLLKSSDLDSLTYHCECVKHAAQVRKKNESSNTVGVCADCMYPDKCFQGFHAKDFGVTVFHTQNGKQDKAKEPILLEDMGFSVRTYNCLKRGLINNLDDLSQKTVEDLRHIRNLGIKSLNEIIDKCRLYGVNIIEGIGE